MITLSAFADEISPNLDEALAVLKECGIGAIDLRGVDGVNVMKLADAQVSQVKKALKRERVSVSCVASPIGKVQVDDALELQIGQMKRAIELAKVLDAPFVRIFSFYLPKGADLGKHRKEVLARMTKLVKMAAGTGVKLVLENEEGLYGDTVERCVDVIKSLKAKHLSLAFDPCNLAIIGPKPFSDSFPAARRHLGYIHAKDWSKDRRAMVPAGEGDAEWEPILAALKAMDFDGFVSLEPHLSAAGQFAGFSGPDMFRKAHASLTGLMQKVGLTYR
jgi:sugar phosphate isomerase/epimerase